MGFRGRITRLSQLVADSITGAYIRTAATGTRWEISSTPANYISAYSGVAGETNPGAILLTANSGGTNLSISAPLFPGMSNPNISITTSGLPATPTTQITQSADKFIWATPNSGTRKSLAFDNTGALQIGSTPHLSNITTWERVPTLNMVYPVGSIYMSVNNTDPGTLFGGTWAAWATGRVPVAVETGQAEFNTVEKTGGSTHHRHNFKIGLWDNNYQPAGPNAAIDSDAGAYRYSNGTFAGAAIGPTTTKMRNAGGTAGSGSVTRFESTGDTDTESAMFPYITCYMWKRTA